MTSPPREIPEKLLDSFTLGGQIPVKTFYFDKLKEREIKEFTSVEIDKFIRIAKQKIGHNYPNTDQWIYEALKKYPVKNKDCVVLGSCNVFYESICLAYGAKSVTTLEYNQRICKDKRIRVMTHHEYDNWCEYTEESCLFDIAFAISSFEHDGLGRYNDPLDAYGDFHAMSKTNAMLRTNGILYLAVPVGIDCIFWNAHRMYGSKRLPMLIDDMLWEKLFCYGWDETKIYKNEDDYHHQPLFILQKK